LKTIFSIFIISLFLFSEEIKGLKELVNYIFPLITHKRIVRVYTLPKYYRYFQSNKFVITTNCKKSDIIFGNINCKDKPIFALSYDFYLKYKNVIGAFYYRKGRPQLKFKKDSFLKFFKRVPKEIKDYIE